jgi:hypothetical protein
MLQAVRSRVQFRMRSMDFSAELIFRAVLWPWGFLAYEASEALNKSKYYLKIQFIYSRIHFDLLHYKDQLISAAYGSNRFVF